MNSLLQPGQHPDADQLSAFAEQALPPHEQQQMLAHLAACPDCRSLVYLVQQASPIESPQPQAVATRQPWFAGWFSGWNLAIPTAALACLILLALHLRNASTPRIQTTPTTTASTAQPQPSLPASPIKPLVVPASVAAASPVRVPPRTTLAFSQKKLQPIAIDRMPASAPIAPAPIVQEAQLTPQMPESGRSVLRATAIGRGSLSGGGITGMVTDPVGAVISHAQVIATNTDTGVQFTRQTTSQGLYSIAPLPVGTYNVEVVAKGFQRLLQENVTVDNNSMFALNLKPTIGGASTTITITDAPPYSNTTDATLGGTIENELYASLPLSMNGGPRNPTAFQYLMPGVHENPANATNQGVTAGASGIYGGTGQTNLNANYVEGVPVSNIAAQGSGTAVASAASAGASATGVASVRRLPTLPSKLPALAVVEHASRTLALDTAGALFRSDDAGVTWISVPPQWQGRPLTLRLSHPPSAAQPAADMNAARPTDARPQTQALAPQVPAFELTTDSGAVYTSSDGQIWQHK